MITDKICEEDSRLDNEALQQPPDLICYLRINKIVDILRRSEKKRVMTSIVKEKKTNLKGKGASGL